MERDAADDEISALARNKILPRGHHNVYWLKYNFNGTVDCYKARLMTKEYSQQEGIDFFDTVLLIAKIVTDKVLLYISNSL